MTDHKHRFTVEITRTTVQRFHTSTITEEGDWTGSLAGAIEVVDETKVASCDCGATRPVRWRQA